MDQRQPTFNELLIHAVQEHPQLYDQQHRVCTDNDERNAIWDEIAARIDDNITGEFAKKRWLQMRDRYRKELKMALRSSVRPKWPYFEKLSWLDPYLKDTRSMKELMDFQYPELGANSLLLESIMAAATSTFLEHQKLIKQEQHSATESSPDSATASASEESDVVSSHLRQINPLLVGIGDGVLQRKGPENGKDSPDSENDTRDAYHHASENPSSITINVDHPLSASSEFSSAIDSLLLIETKQQQQHGGGVGGKNVAAPTCGRARVGANNRNPPYLVRRGGSIKVRNSLRSNTLSSTMSSKSELMAGDAPTTPIGFDTVNSCVEDWSHLDWGNDEDLLFARLVVVRLRKFSMKARRSIRAQIMLDLDQKEEQLEREKTTASAS